MPEDAPEMVTRFRELLTNGRFDEAVATSQHRLSVLSKAQQTELNAMAGTYAKKADHYEAAVTFFIQALAIAPQPELLGKRFDCMYELGHTYLLLNQIEQAVATFEAGLIESENSGAKAQKARFQIGTAQAFVRSGDYPKGIRLYVMAEMTVSGMINAQAGDDDDIPLPNIAILKAEAYEGLRQHHRALYVLHPLRPEETITAASAMKLFLLGRNHRAVGEFEKARASLLEALASAEVLEDRLVESLACEQLGILESGDGRLDDAYRYFLRAIRVVEESLSRMSQEEFRLARRQTWEELYSRTVEAAADLGDVKAAWDISERARARLLLNLLGHNQEPQPTNHIDRPLDDVPVIEIAQLQTLLDPGTLVVEYFVGEESLLCLIATNERIDFRKIAIPKDTLRQHINRLRALVSRPQPKGVMGDARREQYRVIATTLYDRLLGYFADVMSGCRRLILIPHDMLTYLPFAGLLTNTRQATTVSSALPERHYLIDEYELSYAFSMSTLYYSQREPPGRLGKRALIISNSHPADPLPDLPFAEREADLLEGFFPNCRRLRSPDATVENYRHQAPNADVIHLACHAIFDRSNPWLSALCMALDETGRTRLEAQMIRQIKLKANLVTLSACETALGELAPGGEYVGLIRAFLLAGAKTMIGSLWRVEDEATASLMPMFYEALLKEEGKGIAASLRQAQLTMRQSQRFSDPYYWAALAGYGDLR